MDTVYRRSNLLQNLLVCYNLRDKIKIVTDIAFDACDNDGSGDLDQEELHVIMMEVSKQMGVTPPSAEDLAQILKELDESNDGKIDKEEFHALVMMVLGKMLELEEDFQEKTN